MKRAALLVACLSLGAGCSRAALRDYRGIIHCHSLHSHDSKGTYEEILAAAKAADVDFVVMTDHPPSGDPGRPLREGWRGLRDGVLFIQGLELAGSNLLAVGIREPVHGSIPEKIAAVHRQGGLAFVSHPEEVEDWEPYSTADGMEIYNVHAAFKRRQKEEPGFMIRALKKLKEDPERSFSLLQELDEAVIERWDQMNRRRPFTGIAGNDSHQNMSLFGLRLDPYPRAFRFVSTRVRATELTQTAVLDALRAGRCTVVFDQTRGEREVVEKAEEGRRRTEVWTAEDGRRVPWELGNWTR